MSETTTAIATTATHTRREGEHIRRADEKEEEFNAFPENETPRLSHLTGKFRNFLFRKIVERTTASAAAYGKLFVLPAATSLFSVPSSLILYITARSRACVGTGHRDVLLHVSR